MFKSGQIMQNMRENGEKTKQTEEENFGTLMEISMKASGLAIKSMEREFTLIIELGMYTRVTGSLI